MGKTIKLFNVGVNKVVFLSNIYRYELYSGRIQKRFDIERLINDNEYFLNVHDLGFDKFQKSFNYDYRRSSFYVPISINFIKYYQLEWARGKDYILLSKTKLGNITSFYTFSLEVEIKGLRMAFSNSNALPTIYVDIPKDNVLIEKMTRILGNPQNIPELENEKYGSGKRYLYYIVPISRIDKIIGIKKYRDVSTFGQEKGEHFTGEEEEITLDLHNFDENTYRIFKEHGMLEIEGYLDKKNNETKNKNRG